MCSSHGNSARGLLDIRLDVIEAVEKGLQASDRTHICAVFIDFNLKERFALEAILEKVGDERIRPASKVCDIDGKKTGVVLDDLGGTHDFLSKSPVLALHIWAVGHNSIKMKKVHRHGQGAKVPKFLGKVQVDTRIKSVVRPADHHHQPLIRFQLGAYLISSPKKPAIESRLGLPCCLSGIPDGSRADTQCFSKLFQPGKEF